MEKNRIKESTIRNYLGGASFMSGLICFFSGSTYDKSFGKLGFGGLFVYLGINLSIFYLIWGFKRIRVSERFQSVVETILYVAICCISVELDKLVPGKSDALSIISYGLFALMSVSKSRRSELGFDTGFFSFFLSMFLEQLFKTNWKLLPIGLVFGLAAIFFRRHSQSGSPNGDRTEEGVPLITPPAPAATNEDLEAQNPPEESLSSSNNDQNIQEESSEAPHHPPSNYGQVSEAIIGEIHLSSPTRHHFPSNYGQMSEENISDGGEQEEDSTSSLAAGSSYSSGNNQNGYVHSSPPPQLRRNWYGVCRRRGIRMTPAIQNIASSLEDALRRWDRTRLLFFFF